MSEDEFTEPELSSGGSSESGEEFRDLESEEEVVKLSNVPMAEITKLDRRTVREDVQELFVASVFAVDVSLPQNDDFTIAKTKTPKPPSFTTPTYTLRSSLSSDHATSPIPHSPSALKPSPRFANTHRAPRSSHLVAKSKSSVPSHPTLKSPRLRSQVRSSSPIIASDRRSKPPNVRMPSRPIPEDAVADRRTHKIQ